MRIKLWFKTNPDIKVPNNQSVVNSYIHKLLGNNNKYHDSKSNYCVSRLVGGVIVDGGKNTIYKNKAYIVITSKDLEFINSILEKVYDIEFGHGFEFTNVSFIEEKIYDGINYFKTMDNGFIIKDGFKYYTLHDADFYSVLKNHIYNKFSKIDENINWDRFDIEITEHTSNKVRGVYVKNVKNMANICQFKLTSCKRLAELIYNYGIGQSTGSGFGTIYKTENHEQYYSK